MKINQVQYSLAIIYPWVGADTPEKEFILRLQIAADKLKLGLNIINDQGYLLNDDFKLTNKKISEDDLDIVIATHYLDQKLLDAFYYYTLWAPPGYLIQKYNYSEITSNFLNYDDYLIESDQFAFSHLQSILLNSNYQLNNYSALPPSVPSQLSLEPIKNPKYIHYCGTNWDLNIHSKGSRHQGLFKMLDEASFMKFFGPEKHSQTGTQLWQGFNSYKGYIPFDGRSMLEEINKCGIALCFSSKEHRQSGLVSCRLYEACAAGAVIISDDNPFIQKHFKEAALFVDYDENDLDSAYKQIIEKYNWIQHNPTQAREMALKAQQIFQNKFCLTKLLKNIVEKHQSRIKKVDSYCSHKVNDETVDVFYFFNHPQCSSEEERILANIVSNIKKQNFRNMNLRITCNFHLSPEIDKCLQKLNFNNYFIQEKEVYKNKKRVLSSGFAFHEFMNESNADYFIISSGKETWFSNHISQLKRSLEDSPDSHISYSSVIYQFEESKSRLTCYSSKLKIEDIYNLNSFYNSGQLLMKNSVKDYLPDYVFKFIDNNEHDLLSLFSMLKLKKEILFTKKNTLVTPKLLNKKNQEMYTELCQKNYQKKFIQDLFRFNISSPSLKNSLIDFIQTKIENGTINETTNLAIYGISQTTLQILMLLDNHNISPVCFIDSNPKQKTYEGKPVINKEEINDYQINSIIIATSTKPSIEQIVTKLKNYDPDIENKVELTFLSN